MTKLQEGTMVLELSKKTHSQLINMIIKLTKQVERKERQIRKVQDIADGLMGEFSEDYREAKYKYNELRKSYDELRKSYNDLYADFDEISDRVHSIMSEFPLARELDPFRDDEYVDEDEDGLSSDAAAELEIEECKLDEKLVKENQEAQERKEKSCKKKKNSSKKKSK